MYMDIEQDIFRQKMSDKEYERIRRFIEGHYGIKLPPAKKQMVEGRLRKRLRQSGLASYSEYLDYAFNPARANDELLQLIDVITTNKTDFYREQDHFEYLKKIALPRILHNVGSGHVKIWSAGCSSGEEPYTLAIEMHRFAEATGGCTYGIHASDISTDMLRRARTAIYDEEKVSGLPFELKKKYFLRSKDPSARKVRLKPFIRNSVSFSRINLMDEMYSQPADFDVIFCRNVIIYFDKPTQEKILRHLTTHLKRGGFLFLGHSETIHGMNIDVETTAPTIYRKL